MILLLVFLFILLAGPVGATELILPDDWVTPCWEKAPNSSMFYPCAVDVLINKGWLEQRHLAWLKAAQQAQLTSQESCLAKMEQAMRKMERFLPFDDAHGLVNVMPTTELKDFSMAYNKWNDAKRNCWMTP